MKIIHICIGLLLTVTATFMPILTQAKTLAEQQIEFVAPWLVSVDGIRNTRTLKISGITEKAKGVFTLNAVFGVTGGKESPIEAEIRQLGEEVRLELTTQTGAKISATQTSDGSFVGSFTPPNGEQKNVTIRKNSEGEIHSAANLQPLIKKPADNVPAACAAFSGKWTGTWTEGNMGTYWLWISEVGTDCIVKYALLGHERSPKHFSTTKIENGKLSFICNRSTDGTCIFERSGDGLRVNYSNPSGGRNWADYKKIQ